MREEYTPEGFRLFYLELSQTDYLRDIEIQDEYEDPNFNEKQGLSDAQVSEIARDSLRAAKEQRNKIGPLKQDSAESATDIH